MTLAIEQQEELLLFLVDKLGKKEFDLPPLPHVASQVPILLFLTPCAISKKCPMWALS